MLGFIAIAIPLLLIICGVVIAFFVIGGIVCAIAVIAASEVMRIEDAYK